MFSDSYSIAQLWRGKHWSFPEFKIREHCLFCQRQRLLEYERVQHAWLLLLEDWQILKCSIAAMTWSLLNTCFFTFFAVLFHDRSLWSRINSQRRSSSWRRKRRFIQKIFFFCRRNFIFSFVFWACFSTFWIRSSALWTCSSARLTCVSSSLWKLMIILTSLTKRALLRFWRTASCMPFVLGAEGFFKGLVIYICFAQLVRETSSSRRTLRAHEQLKIIVVLSFWERRCCHCAYRRFYSLECMWELVEKYMISKRFRSTFSWLQYKMSQISKNSTLIRDAVCIILKQTRM